MLSSGFAPTASAQPADGYQYLRFVPEGIFDGSHITEVTFLNGEDVIYPKLPFSSSAGTPEARLIGEYPYLSYALFDGVAATDERVFFRDQADGEREVTLAFSRVVYPNGIRIARPPWSPLPGFRVEGAQEAGGPWTVLYRAPEGFADEFGEIGRSETGARVDGATFWFGTDPVDVPTSTPPSPEITVDRVAHNAVELSWVGVEGGAGYEVTLNGESQGFTTSSTFALAGEDVQPLTTYVVSVIAYDGEFNASAPASVEVTTPDRPVAEGYSYVRFWLTDGGGRDPFLAVGMKWVMGDRLFPLEPITSAEGDDAVEILSTNANLFAFDGPFKLFDEDDRTHWYTPVGNEVTLRFKNSEIYPTGIELTCYTWATVGGFRAEGSQDGETWTTLYSADGLVPDDFPRDGDVRRRRFDFGVTLPDDLDLTAPSVPANLSVTGTDATSADVSWDASTDDDSGVGNYTVYVDGAEWLTTTSTEATLYGLSPSTSYAVAVAATDQLGNASEAGEAVTASTRALPAAVGSMRVGVGLGVDFRGVIGGIEGRFREGVDFAAEWADYENSNPFSETYLAETAHNSVFRFMDPLPTNNNWIVDWADRRQPDDPDQAVYPNYDDDLEAVRQGIAIEWLIKLCNVQGADMWINVPHAASDDYVRELARLVNRYLDPELEVYIEYSNEVFAGFGAERYANERGFALGFDKGDFGRYDWFGDDEYARFRYYVHRSTQIYAIFDEVFGEDADRVEKVLSGWTGQPGVTRVHLDALDDPAVNPAGYLPDHYALAPYFGINRTIEAGRELQAFRRDVETVVARVATHYDILAEDGRNIPLITYEAGQHYTRGGEALNRTPEMYQAYIEYLDGLSPYITLFTQFVDYWTFRQGMAWGAKEYVGQPDLEAFKYRAIKDWLAVNGDNAEVLAPLVYRQPGDVTVAEGSGATFETTVLGEQPLTYQWYKNGVALEGATERSLVLGQQPLTEDGAVYTFTVSNRYGSATSDPITLAVVEQPKASVARVGAPVTVDGVAEAAWSSATAYPLANVNLGVVDDAADLEASFRALWDDDYLYVLVEVTDDALVGVPEGGQIYNFDGVEVYVDGNNGKGEAYDDDDRQVVFAYGGDGLVGGSGRVPLGDALAEQVATATGYVTEFAFPWADLGVDPRAGYFVGLDVMAVDNDTPGGDRDGKLAWWATEDFSWRTPGNFGTALLDDGAPAPIANLVFTSMCSDDPAVERRWRVRNPNDVDVAVRWKVYGYPQAGALVAAPGDNFFTTATVPGANTTRISWLNEEGQRRFRTKASGRAQCVGARTGAASRESFETAARVFPNPARDQATVSLPSGGEALGDVTIAFTDALGREVSRRRYAYASALTLPLGDLPAGMYQVTLTQAHRRAVRTLLVE